MEIVTDNKIATSCMIEWSIRQKMKRISKILKVTESSLMEDALKYYFENSPICEEAQRRILDDQKFLQREIRTFGSRGYEYRKGDDGDV